MRVELICRHREARERRERLKNQDRWEDTEGLNPVSNSISIFNKESDIIQEHNVHLTEKGIDITYFAILSILKY